MGGFALDCYGTFATSKWVYSYLCQAGDEHLHVPEIARCDPPTDGRRIPPSSRQKAFTRESVPRGPPPL